MSMSFQASTIRNSFWRTPDVSHICLLPRSLCTGSYYPALFGPSIRRKLIGFIPLFTPLVTLHPLACRCPLNLLGWWEVQFNLSPLTGPIGIEQKGLITSSLCLMTLVPASIIRYDFLTINICTHTILCFPVSFTNLVFCLGMVVLQ